MCGPEMGHMTWHMGSEASVGGVLQMVSEPILAVVPTG
jgi:hypothetical protein